jgi:glucuronate isomerase
MTPSLQTAQDRLYHGIKDLPIVSPHGHCEPAWFAQNLPFANPAELLVVPDHYVCRMLYSQGVPLARLGVGTPGKTADPREVFRIFAQHWHLFLGTPSRTWIRYVLNETLSIKDALSPETADKIYDDISDMIARDDHRPRALFDRFNIEVLATTDSALDDLQHHASIRASRWQGRIIPTFRPDSVLDPSDPGFVKNLDALIRVISQRCASAAQTLRRWARRRRITQLKQCILSG